MRLSSKEVNVVQKIVVPQMDWLVRVYLWLCERLYHELAWGYDGISWLVSGGRWRRWQAGVWREIRGRSVLEMGFGTGELLVQGAPRNLQMVGIDRSPTMLAVASMRAQRAGIPICAIQGDGRILPFADAIFDTVVATFPAGYILAAETLVEMQRVLQPGGRVVLLGLWVELRLGKLGQVFPFFYGKPSDASLNAIAQRVAGAGFQTRWVEQRDGRFTIGVLVADKEQAIGKKS